MKLHTYFRTLTLHCGFLSPRNTVVSWSLQCQLDMVVVVVLVFFSSVFSTLLLSVFGLNVNFKSMLSYLAQSDDSLLKHSNLLLILSGTHYVSNASYHTLLNYNLKLNKYALFAVRGAWLKCQEYLCSD